MTKMHVNITIDYECWLFVKTTKISMSKIVNKMIRQMMEEQELSTDIIKLRLEAAATKEEIQKNNNKLLLIEDKLNKEITKKNLEKNKAREEHRKKNMLLPPEERTTYIKE